MCVYIYIYIYIYIYTYIEDGEEEVPFSDDPARGPGSPRTAVFLTAILYLVFSYLRLRSLEFGKQLSKSYLILACIPQGTAYSYL